MADEAISQLAFFHENLKMNETFTWDNTQPNYVILQRIEMGLT